MERSFRSSFIIHNTDASLPCIYHSSLPKEKGHKTVILTPNAPNDLTSYCFYRSCQWWNGLFQSPQSVGWDAYHAWRLSRLWIRWHWSSLPEILSCHQRAFKSDENTGKFTKRNGWPLFPLCWVLLAFDVLFQETFYVAVQVREHSIAFLEMKNFFFKSRLVECVKWRVITMVR